MKSAVFAIFALAASVVSSQTITCQTQQIFCDTQLGANHACCGALFASCTAGKTTPEGPYNQCSAGPPCPTCTAKVPAATASTVASACADQFTLCKTQVGENNACCASLQASCLSGETSPTADVSQCSNGPPCPTCTGTGASSGSGSPSGSPSVATVTSAAPTASSSALASACAAQFTACKSQIGENNACCASLQASCLSGETSPTADVSQCSNGPPCPTCTGTGASSGSGSSTQGSSQTTLTSATSASGAAPAATTTSLVSSNGASDGLRVAQGVFAVGLAAAVML